jgi:hypothetical protein
MYEHYLHHPIFKHYNYTNNEKNLPFLLAITASLARAAFLYAPIFNSFKYVNLGM